jgi:glucose/arabinose dehydrogenase
MPRTACARLAAVLGLVLLSSPPARAQLRPRVVTDGLTAPLAFVQDPSRPGTQYIVEQGGRIRVLQDGRLEATDFLNLSASIASGSERGLLGLAFPTDYGASGRFYVNFTDLNGDTVVARFRRSVGNPLVADPSSRFDLLWSTGERVIRQPFANHNGGDLAFGPDGYLYVGMGDGGSGGDPGNRAQDPNTLLGKMLRIDVSVADSDTKGFRVPPDNPFLSGAPISALPEIWDFGLRNPWRFSFDDVSRGGTGALIIGDVGQGAWEEIDYEPAAAHGGRNYGWRYMEGSHPYITTLPPAYLPLTNPTIEYDHTVGVAVVGGIVYRGGMLLPSYRGRYFYADFGGRVWSAGLSIDPNTGEATLVDIVEHSAELGGTALGTVVSFGTDAAGELYLVCQSSGRIVRISSAFQQAASDFDGDRRTDPAVFRDTTGTWFLRNSGGTAVGVRWGASGDVAVGADYDGDGRADIAVFRPSTGTWFVVRSGTGSGFAVAWGTAGDLPVPADYDGDGRADVAVFRPSTGAWFIIDSRTGTGRTLPWGANGDVPVPADYDGDGKADIAVFRPSNGVWYIIASRTGIASARAWGALGDVPAPADYDGDGLTDVAVFRPSSGTWFVVRSSTGTGFAVAWGTAGDVPVPGDYDGDGRADVAVFRPSAGGWYVVSSSTGAGFGLLWGTAGDTPV